MIAFVDLVPVATEKVSLIRSNTVWNRWKSTLSARSIRVSLNHGKEIIAFVKERFHNAVEIDILGIFEGYSSLQIWPPQKFFRGEIIQGE